jgi:predicted SAM-dependent methyltransferase
MVRKSRKRKYSHIKLDIACGANKQAPDWIGIDVQKFPGVDIVHDIETYPWPLPDECVSIAVGSHIAEHINPAKFGFINWMNEIWRVLEVEGRLMLALPYGGSPGYWMDPTHVNGCNENTWNYFDPLHESKFYRFYRPSPWRIISCVWDTQGFMEVVLEKRRKDSSYLG